jgi:regulator of sigma E protease
MDNSRDTQADSHFEDTFSTPDPNNAPRDSWVRRHGLLIVVLTAAFAYFMTQFNALSVIMVVVGISLLIFVHELGHFLVAKWCDVHVLTFSIGLGPAIPGCSFRWGETTYKLGIIPLGGYVKMVGEGANEDDDNDDLRSFKNKSVGQRMAIISAGVTMNIIFGFACFVYVYMAHGEKRIPAMIDSVEVGSAAWQIGVRSGEVVYQIGDKKNPYFDDFLFQVMNSVKGEKLDLVVGPPGVPERDLTHLQIEPQRRESDQKPMVGVYFSPQDLRLFPESMKKHRPIPVRKESAAAEANPPFEFGDEILGTTDPADPDNLEKILPLPADARNAQNSGLRDYYEFHKRLQLLAGKKMVIQVRRAKSSQIDSITVPAEHHFVFPGLVMEMGEIVALRHNSPAAKAGVEIHDVIEEVQVVDALNRTHRFTMKSQNLELGDEMKPLDPMRLPFELNQWAAQKSGDRKVNLVVRRGEDKHNLTLDWDDSWRFNNESPRPPRWSVSLSGLGIAYQVNTTVADVEANSFAWEKGLRKNDVIKSCQFMKLGKKADDPPQPESWVDLKPNTWAEVFAYCQVEDVKELMVRVERENKEILLHSQRDESWPQDSRGLILYPRFQLVKADNVGQAVAMGWGRTWDFIKGIYGNLRALATGQVSTDLLSGPISVAEAAYSVADEDFYQYVLFLGIISINLAIVNFLPIPVLDGGHMVFLIYEKLMSRPASRQVRIATTYLGVALIFSLMAFVIYLDLRKKFTGG